MGLDPDDYTATGYSFQYGHGKDEIIRKLLHTAPDYLPAALKAGSAEVYPFLLTKQAAWLAGVSSTEQARPSTPHWAIYA